MLLRIDDTLINWNNVEWVQAIVEQGASSTNQICVRFSKDTNKDELILKVVNGWEALHQIEQAVINDAAFAEIT